MFRVFFSSDVFLLLLGTFWVVPFAILTSAEYILMIPVKDDFDFVQCIKHNYMNSEDLDDSIVMLEWHKSRSCMDRFFDTSLFLCQKQYAE